MIPILYTKDETAFASNGLGRLVECIRCEVTEERNGIYECEFDYPISGRFCNEMMENGGVISVTHDDNGDKQAFDIYGYSAPIDGVVTFNAHHISYRLNGVIVTPFNANSCAAALQGIKTHSANNNPFTFSTDKTASGPYTVATPSNARGLLAGNAGSVLDIYGTGEYKFDMFNVGLFLHRGRNTDVQIRYGKNLTDITSTLDKSATFNAIAPYWTNGEETVTLPEVYIALSGETDIYCVPVDLTADFENKPTVGELRADANRYLSTINPNVPDENITIDFAALWQTTDYEDVAALERVGLCDTVSIYFEALGVTQAQAKIIKVVYDVLRERYISMEFGKVQTTLAEAILGTSASGLQDLSAGQVIGASIITAALIKAATSRFAEVYIGGDGYTPGIIYLQDQYDETKGTIGNSGLSFEAGGQDFAAFSANSKKLNFEFAPQDDGTLYPSKNILSLETIEDNYSEEWDAFEQAYGEIQVARVKVNNGAATQADKIIINSKNGARIELYDASGTGLLTQVVPRIFKQLFPNGNTAVELGNDANGSHLKLNDPNGDTVINLDTQNGSTFGNGVSVTGGTNTDTLSASGNATVGGALSVTNRRSYLLSNVAEGWHRVLEFSPTTVAHRLGRAGIIVDFDITRFGTTNETHHVSLSLIETNAKFYGEFSNSNTQLIDKIRYTYDSSKGYVDIHLSTSWSANVAVDYQVSASFGAALRQITTKSLAVVADSPSGETVLTEYALNANGAGDITYNGDATVGGVLGVTNRQAYARLSSAGWYRVCWLKGGSQYSPIGALGALIRFNIIVYGNDGNNGNHQIDYISTYGTGNRKFTNEQSNGVDTKVDKIRCMQDGNDFYIDIHFTASSNTDVYVFWDFFTSLSFLGKLTTKNLEPVADAPSGETSLAEYSFSSNGVFFGDLFTNGALLLPFLTVGDAIPSNANLHNYKTAGVYYATQAVARTLSNSSITTVPFKLIVMPDNGGVWQIELAAFSNCIIAIQYFNGSTWGGWKRLTPA